MDEIVRAVSADGMVKLTAISAKGIVEKARKIHGMSSVASAALGRALCAASMLGNMLKEENGSVTLRINGGGPLGTIMAVSDSSGNVRGYTQNPEVELPRRTDGKLDVGTAVGRHGTLTVSRDLGLKEPYIGQSALVSGEVAEDLAAHFLESEQIGTACALGVLVGGTRGILAAGGYIVQLMPGAPGYMGDILEENIRLTGPVTTRLIAGDATELASSVLRTLSPCVLGRFPVCYHCACSKDRVKNALLSLGHTELHSIAAGNENLSASCQFCSTVYSFTPAETRRLAGEVLLSSDSDKGEKPS